MDDSGTPKRFDQMGRSFSNSSSFVDRSNVNLVFTIKQVVSEKKKKVN